MTIRHLVLLAFNPTTTSNDIALIAKELNECCKKIAGSHFGIFSKLEHASGASNYTHYFFIDFENEDSRKNYLDDEDHKNIAVNKIIPKLSNGTDSVIVFDYIKMSKSSSKQENDTYQLGKSNSWIILSKQPENSVSDKSLQDTIADVVQQASGKVKFKENCTIENLHHGFNNAAIVKLSKTDDSFPLKIQNYSHTALTVFFNKLHIKTINNQQTKITINEHTSFEQPKSFTY